MAQVVGINTIGKIPSFLLMYKIYTVAVTNYKLNAIYQFLLVIYILSSYLDTPNEQSRNST